MEKDYVENLKAVAGVGGNKISEKNLVLLKEKYNLTEEGMKEMKAYCNTHRILIYDEIAKGEFAEDMNDVKPSRRKSVPIEERNRLKKSRVITKRIMHLASVSARKRVEGRGWLCGTYTSSVRRSTERFVMRKFVESEMDYIIEHFPPENDEDICFQMMDDENPEKITYYNSELNSMIPRLIINRFYSDLFEE